MKLVGVFEVYSVSTACTPYNFDPNDQKCMNISVASYTTKVSVSGEQYKIHSQACQWPIPDDRSDAALARIRGSNVIPIETLGKFLSVEKGYFPSTTLVDADELRIQSWDTYFSWRCPLWSVFNVRDPEPTSERSEIRVHSEDPAAEVLELLVSSNSRYSARIIDAINVGFARIVS